MAERERERERENKQVRNMSGREREGKVGEKGCVMQVGVEKKRKQ